jgi:gliding motility-associated protein GldL
MKKTLNMVTSLGAAIVILGAWMKITHHRYADLALTLGLWTEAIIFVIYAFLPEEGEPVKVDSIQLDTNEIKKFNVFVTNLKKAAKSL